MSYDFLFDTHTHIDGKDFADDFESVVEKSASVGVKKIVIPAIEPAGYDRLRLITQTYADIYQGIGIHPHSADKWSEEIGELIKKETLRDKVVAIGEIGLEYFYDFVPKDIQQNVFEWHLSLAAYTGLPALIHSRDAEQKCIDTFEKIKSENNGKELGGVMHCFSESVKIMENAINSGLMISFTGNITFKKFANLETVESVPLDKFMLETDAPYMAPVPHRGKRNEPSFVRNVAEKVAEIKKLPLEEIIYNSTKNAMNFFKLSIFIITALCFTNIASAQDRYEGYEDDDSEVDNSSPKTLGIGFILGSNTIIDKLTYTTYNGEDGVSSRSADGLLAYGASLNYHINKYFMIEGSYIYSQNQQIAEDNPGIDPYQYNLFLSQGYFFFNPENAIEFFISLGGGVMFAEEDYSVLVNPEEGIVEVQKFNFNNLVFGGSFGIAYDLELSGGHTINLSAALQLFTQPEELLGSFQITNSLGQTDVYNEVPFTRNFSIPQFKITYYPPLF